MGSLGSVLHLKRHLEWITPKKIMKFWLLILAVGLLCAEVKAAPAPIERFLSQLNKSGLKNLGTNKILAGAAIKGVGYLTNRQDVKNLGKKVIGAGIVTKLAAHFLGK